MSRWLVGSLTLAVGLSGCSLDGLPSLSDVASQLGTDIGPVGLDVPSGWTRVQLVNASGHEADVRITMQVAGERVHFSLQHLAIDESNLVIGPDRADSVLVEITLLGDPDRVLAPLTYFLDHGFHSGDTIFVPIAVPSDGDDSHGPGGDGGDAPGGGDQAEPPLQPITLAIEGLRSDVRVKPGMSIGFDVVVTGEPSSTGRISVFADPDRTAASGDEITIAANRVIVTRVAILWIVPDLSPGRYYVYAEARDGTSVARSEFAPGAVQVDTPPGTP